MATQNSEDYLRSIYKLQHGDEAVATSRIAAALGIRPPSVTDMVQRLAHDGLVQYQRYNGVRLTAAGRRLALGVTRRHRLWEMFLVRTLNFSWDEVHVVADLLEHATPPLLESRIDEFLGHPSVDPHGDPIPSIHGALPPSTGVCLNALPAGAHATVVRVVDDSPEALQMLAQLGIQLNRKLKVINVAEYDGSLHVRIGTRQAFLSKELAAIIYVAVAKRG